MLHLNVRACVATLLAASLTAVSVVACVRPAAASTAADVLPVQPSLYSSAQAPRLASGINPPTNSWISGAVFNKDGLFAPTWVGGGLVFRAKPTSIGVALPALWTYADKAIMATWERNGDATGTESQVIHLAPAGATDYKLTRIDELSADLTWYGGGTALGTLTAVEGWPYVQYRALASQSIAIDRPLTAVSPGHWSWVSSTGHTMHVVTTGGTLSGQTLTLPAGAMVHVYAAPDGASASDLAALVAGAVRVTGATSSYAVANGRASTTFTLVTDGGRPTVYTAERHQAYGLPTLTGTWPNATGPAKGVVGTTFTYSVPAYASQRDVDLSKLTSAERAELVALVRTDAAATSFTADDTYFAGKQLYRATTLYRLAVQLGMTPQAAALKAAITGQLDLWFNPNRCATASTKCFTYDATLKTVVGHSDSFGSGENANDHHFHYGYFLAAAGTLALDDPSLVARYSAVANALVADIASTTNTATTIQRRSFDDWRGHSWANGTGGGMDGNDQESTSEAVNAWAGLDLWARASGDATTMTQARWMLSNEAATANAYWFNPYTTSTFTKTHISMMFAGKTDYRTWWSNDASDILGIQAIPLGPTQFGYLKSLGAAKITELFNGVLATNASIAGRSHLIDWDIMLLGLADPARAASLATQLTDADIDGGNSRSYLYAVIHSGTPTDAGTQPPSSPTPTPVPAPPTTTATPTQAPTATPTTSPSSGPVSASKGFFASDAAAASVGLTGRSTLPAASGNWLRFSVDFGTGGYSDAVARVSSGAADGVSGLVEVRTGSQTGPVLGSIAVASTGSWTTYRNIPFNVAGLTGVQNLYVTFTSGQGAPFVSLQSLVFRVAGTGTPPVDDGSPVVGPSPTASPSPTCATADAYQLIPVTAACTLHGLTRSGVRTSPAGNGDWIAFPVDFGTGGVVDALATVSSGAGDGVSGLIELRLDAPTAPVAGSLALTSTGGWDTDRSVPFNVKATTGVHTVYVTFTSAQPADFAALRDLRFRR